MTKDLLALSLGFAGLIFLTHPAQAQQQPQCGPRAAVLKTLTERGVKARIRTGNGAVLLRRFPFALADPFQGET